MEYTYDSADQSAIADYKPQPHIPDFSRYESGTGLHVPQATDVCFLRWGSLKQKLKWEFENI